MKHAWFIWSLAIFVLLVIIVWIGEITSGVIPFLDQWTRSPVEAMISTSMYDFFRFMTQFGSREFMVLFVIVMVIGLTILYRDWLQGAFFAGGTLLTFGLNELIKHVIERERPSILEAASAEGFSFPSGHAMISFVAYGLLMYFWVKRIRSPKAALVLQIGIALLVALIGFSRYWINVHFLTDVLAGFVFGFLILLGLIKLYVWTADHLRKNNP